MQLDAIISQQNKQIVIFLLSLTCIAINATRAQLLGSAPIGAMPPVGTRTPHPILTWAQPHHPVHIMAGAPHIPGALPSVRVPIHRHMSAVASPDWLSFRHAIDGAGVRVMETEPESIAPPFHGELASRRRPISKTQVGGGVGSKGRPLAHSPFAFDSGINNVNNNSTRHVQNRGQTTTQNSRQRAKKLVCYYGTWAVYRPDAGKYPVENIDPHLCTHVIYGFTGLSYDNTIKPLDPWNDLEENYGKGAMKRFTNLKRLNPDLKTLIAIGGWNEGSIKYSRMAAEPEARAKFVDSVVRFMQKYNFDGLDLDWEYPGSRGGVPSDKQNFVSLLRELKRAFEPHGFLLTAAVSAGLSFAQPAYDIPQVSKYLDLINLMAYDYHGGWETKTGHNAPLFHSPRHDLSREDRQLNVNWSVNYWLQHGAPAEKIMLGTGSYGRSFTLDKESENGFNAPASQKGRAGPYTREPGSLGYNEICESFQQQGSSWKVVRDPDYMVPYAYNGRLWVGYDDRESIALKAQYAKSMGLGGMMMWSIETDDFQGRCHGEKYPLLKTINRVMNGLVPVPIPNDNKPIKPTPKPATSTTSTTRRPVIHTSTTTIAPDREVEGDSRPHPPATSSTTSTRRPTQSTTKNPRVKPSRRPAPTSSTTTSTTSTTPKPRPTFVSTTSSTTTSRPPPASSHDFVCQADGMFADPKNCRKFIRCVSQFGNYAMYRFDCAPGTAYNEPQGYCDHLYNVPSCNHKHPLYL